QNEKSQIQNRIRATEVLRARLQALAEEKAQQEASEQRRSQVRTVDRSERVRTYNFPENRISDHRVNYKAYNLDAVLDGARRGAGRTGQRRPRAAPAPVMRRQPLRLAVLEAERILTDAGVASPRVDAELLAAHVVGVPRGRLPMVPLVDPPVVDALRTLVSQRAQRVPLQHLTGTAAMGAVEVAVGPGVFIPRPETEVMLAWGLAMLDGAAEPLVVDLCTGSGALALA